MAWMGRNFLVGTVDARALDLGADACWFRRARTVGAPQGWEGAARDHGGVAPSVSHRAHPSRPPSGGLFLRDPAAKAIERI